MKKTPEVKLAFIFSTFSLSLMLVIIGLIVYSFSQGTSLSATQSFAQSEVKKNIEYRTRSENDMANEDGNLFNPLPQKWLGNGEFVSFLGIRFQGEVIPAGSNVESAAVDLGTPSDSWIGVGFQVSGEKLPIRGDFGSTSRPSSRALTTSSYTYNDNVKWVKGAYYTYDVTRIVQEISAAGQTDTITLIFKGTGGKWGRRILETTSGSPTAPRLRITYAIAGSVASVTPTPAATSIPTTAPTVRATTNPTTSPRVTATPTPIVTVRPTVAPSLPAVTATPTATSMPHQHSGGESEALNAWGISGKNRPNVAYDYCVYGTNVSDRSQRVGMSGLARDDSDASMYVTQAHKRFRVQGPDGKWYPTWHKPVETFSENGRTVTCVFGHEHGRDPKGSELWRTKQIQNYFYFDANKNGQMDSAEEAVSGLPFGYVNEQLATYNASRGSAVMRHEDHVGHKVEYANGEGDTATHQANNLLTGGVFVGKMGDGVIAKDTGVRCYYLAKPHQGVSSNDAFTNSIHEVFYFADCRHTNAAYNQKISIATIEAFGTPGGFTSFQPMCGVQRRSSPQDFIFLGPESMRTDFPSGDGDREIITRDCIEKGFLVEAGRWSGNLYEAWPASLSIEDRSGRRLASGINLLFDVQDANRYFYPEATKRLRGYNNPEAGLNVGFSMDLCYDRSLSGRQSRGGICDWATNYGQLTIKWNDPRSGFRGLNRGMYFQPAVLNNAGGSEFVYTDPYGKNAQSTPFTGSVRQQISVKNVDYGRDIIQDSIDPRVIMRTHSDGGRTVHAPN